MASKNSIPAPKDPLMSYEEVKEKLSVTLKNLCITLPEYGGLALLVPTRAYDGDSAPAIAWTNGNSIVVTDQFAALDLPNRIGVLLHEVFHVGFRHVTRAKARLARDGELNHMVYNIAGDAIINEALYCLHGDTVQLPHGCIRVEHVLPKNVLDSRPITEWNIDDLYDEIMKSVPTKAQMQKLMQQLADKYGTGDMQPDGDGSGDPQDGDGQDGSGSEPENAFGPRSQDAGAKEAMDSAVWERRIKAVGEATANKTLQGMASQFKVKRVDWKTQLRQFMRQQLGVDWEYNWSNPPRRWIGLNAASGRSLPMQPTVKPKPGLKKLAVIIDTSGSLAYGPYLANFLTHVNSIMESLPCEIVLIEADADVKRVRRFKKEPVPLSVQLLGGGGTDFRPALKLACKEQADAIIYFTDLYGEFGREIDHSNRLLWISWTDGVKVPFGRLVGITAPD